jgi:hypothetical protein
MGTPEKKKEKVPFRPQFLYILIIFFNLVVVAFSMYMIFTDNDTAVSRVVLEAAVLLIIFVFFVYSLFCLYDAKVFKEEWSLMARLKYNGNVMHYAVAHMIGHAILLTFVIILDINGESNLTFTQYDTMAIALSFVLMLGGILVSEPPYESILPVTVPPQSLVVAENKMQRVSNVTQSQTSSVIIDTRPKNN